MGDAPVGILEHCATHCEYDNWTVLKAAILQRLEEIVHAFQGFESRRLALVDSGASFSEAATRSTKAGLANCTARVAEFQAALNSFDKRCVVRNH